MICIQLHYRDFAVRNGSRDHKCYVWAALFKKADMRRRWLKHCGKRVLEPHALVSSSLACRYQRWAQVMNLDVESKHSQSAFSQCPHVERRNVFHFYC